MGFLEIAKERKMLLFGNGTRHPEDLQFAHSIMHGHVPGNRVLGSPQRKWADGIVQWIGLRVAEAVRASSSRYRWYDVRYQSASTDQHGL